MGLMTDKRQCNLWLSTIFSIYKTLNIMRIITLSILVLTISSQVFAQDAYQLFRADVQYIYRHQLPANEVTSPLLGIRVGESPCQTTYESVLPDFLNDALDCGVRVPAFPGSEICREGAMTRLNLQSDEDPLWLELQTDAPVGTQWLAAITSDSVFAQVTAVESAEFLGLTDSVKTIEFYSRDEQGNLTPIYDSAPLRISKNYGLIKGVFLHWLGTDLGGIELVGMSEPEVGIQNPDRASIFNLSVGDEFHWSTINTEIFPEGGFEHTYTEEQAILTEQYWTTGNEERIYVFTKDVKTYFVGPESATDTLYEAGVQDIVRINWDQHAWLDAQPGTLIDEESQVVVLNNPSLCDLPAKQLGNELFLFDEECIGLVIDLGPGDFFYEGLAGPFFANVFILGFQYRVLEYARLQNGTGCGTPFDFIVSTDDPVGDIPLQAWPNPASEVLNLSCPAESGLFEYQIMNGHGQILRETTDIQFPVSIDLADLPAGVYWVTITNSDGQLRSRVPFVKQ